MTTIDPSELSKTNSRKLFFAALGLFLVWVTFLFALGMLSATGPSRRTSAVEVESRKP